MDKLVPAFQRTLFDPSLGDLCMEIAEFGIDTLLDEGVFKSLPIVGLLVGAGKTAQNVHDRNLLRQTVQFINTFNEKTITVEKREAYKVRLRDNPRFAEEELGRVLILLNATVDLKKSELLAKFYWAYVEGKIDWEQFCELSDVTARMFISDIDLLYAIYAGQISDTTQCHNYQADRLIALGLLSSSVKSMVIGRCEESRTLRHVTASTLGNNFCEFSK